MDGRGVARLLAVLIWFAPVAALAEADGQALYRDACAACHGVDGRGAPDAAAIKVPLPDFTDCQISTREPNPDWTALVAHGGQFLGMSMQMPAFGEALTPSEITAVLDYVRSFCTNPYWPRGELNFRRPVFVTKAFPENEALIAFEFEEATSERVYTTELAIEGRIGARGQVELALPIPVIEDKNGATVGGFGDLALAYKHVLYASLLHHSIVALATDLVLPSGDRDRGLGDGTTTFEPALLTGHSLAGVVLQTQFRAVVPIDVDRAPRHFLYRFALQYPLGPLKNAVVPGLEAEFGQKIAGEFRDYGVLGPSLYLPLSKRGHVALGVGAQFPVTDHRPFDYRIAAFFLWEYLDGGIWW